MTSTSSTSSAPDGRIVVGRILRPHGVRGELVVEILSEVPDRFSPGRRLWLAPRNGPAALVEIVAARQGPGGASLVRLAGFEDRDQADGARGALLEVDRSEVPPPPAGSYYLFDLVGCLCVDESRGEIGRISEVREDGGGLLLVARGELGEILVPYVAAIVRQVDLRERRVSVHLPEGLIEACASRS